MEFISFLCLVLVAVVAVNSAGVPLNGNAGVENKEDINEALRKTLGALLHNARDTADVQAHATQHSNENQEKKSEMNAGKANAHEINSQNQLEHNLQRMHTQNRRKGPVGANKQGKQGDKRAAHLNGHVARNAKRNQLANKLHGTRSVHKNTPQRQGPAKRRQQKSTHNNQRKQVDSRYYDWSGYTYPDYYVSDDGSYCSCSCQIDSSDHDYGYDYNYYDYPYTFYDYPYYTYYGYNSPSYYSNYYDYNDWLSYDYKKKDLEA